MNPVKQIGEVIRDRRKKLRLTQANLAEYSGLSRKSLHGIEVGTANPTFKQVEKVFNVLGLQIEVKATNA